MNGWKPATLLACFALAVACGGAQNEPTNPTGPTPSATDTSATAPTTTSSAARTAAATTSATAAPTSSAPSSSGGTSSGGAGATASINWDAMSHDQKLDYMKNTVLPKMKAEFQAADGTRFAKFSCKTCHGKAANDGTFKMPAADIPKLDASNNFAKHQAKTPDLLHFMFEKVEPDMAALIGEKPFDMKTMQGFGCFNCHTKQ